MQAALVLLTMLALLGTMLSGAMLIAWRDFGRPRHALSWAMAFALISLQWIGIHVQVALRLPLMPPGSPTFLLQLAFSALMLAGFRQRSGRRVHGGAIAAAYAAASIAMLLLLFGAAERGLATTVPKLASAAFLLLAAQAVPQRGRPRTAAERGAIAMLLLFAGSELVTGITGLVGRGTDQSAARSVYFALTSLIVPSVFAGTGLFTVFLLAADLSQRMQLLARTDPLTGLLNRRGLEDALRALVGIWRRRWRGGSVVIADLDMFKKVNDDHGHAAGDAAIQHFARIALARLRRGELIGRIGGEEFALVLPGVSTHDALIRAEELRRAAADLRLSDHPALCLTVSLGVARMEGGGSPTLAYAAALGRADAALLAAKARGRDKVLLAPDR